MCQSGAFNPAVTEANFHDVICVGGTSQFRPPVSYTNALKVKQIGEYGYKDTSTSAYEQDHFIPLALGGDPKSPQNLWPEPYSGQYGARLKDKLEYYLYRQTCDGKIPLAEARLALVDWVSAYEHYHIASFKSLGLFPDHDDS